MHVGHQQAIPAHRGLERLRRPAIDGGVLANHGPLADLHSGFFAGELEILRQAAEDRADAHFDVRAERYVALESGAWRDDAPVANDTVIADDRVWSHCDVRP